MYNKADRSFPQVLQPCLELRTQRDTFNPPGSRLVSPPPKRPWPFPRSNRTWASTSSLAASAGAALAGTAVGIGPAWCTRRMAQHAHTQSAYDMRPRAFPARAGRTACVRLMPISSSTWLTMVSVSSSSFSSSTASSMASFIISSFISMISDSRSKSCMIF